jgi:FkbM family methyltransferase
MKAEAIVAIQRAARRIGIDIQRHRPSHAERLVEVFRAAGVSLVADVGANVGDWAREIRDAGYAGRIVSVEPLSEPFGRLERRAARDPNWTAVRCAAGAAEATATINVSGTTQSSSLLAMQKAHVEAMPESRYVGTEDVRVRRLDDVLGGSVRPADRLFVKLDVQGFEAHALDGLGALLGSVAALQAELALVPLYDGQPDWRELVDRMEREGFEIFSMQPAFTNPDTGRTLQVDIVFRALPRSAAQSG